MSVYSLRQCNVCTPLQKSPGVLENLFVICFYYSFSTKTSILCNTYVLYKYSCCVFVQCLVQGRPILSSLLNTVVIKISSKEVCLRFFK